MKEPYRNSTKSDNEGRIKLEPQKARLEALRSALQDGSNSGKSTLWDLGAFLHQAKAQRPKRADNAPLLIRFLVQERKGMPRYRITITEQQVQKALSTLILVHGFTPQQAADLILAMFDDIYEWQGTKYYSCYEIAHGEGIFLLNKKYRLLFGSGIQIQQVD